MRRALPVCERLLRAGLDWDQVEWSTPIGRDLSRLFSDWLDQDVAETDSTYNRSFPCMDGTYLYAIKNQRKTRNVLRSGLLVP